MAHAYDVADSISHTRGYVPEWLMAKLYFRYGVVSSAKTLNLLATLHNYEQQGKKAILIKPALDTRSTKVESRAGLSHVADIILKESDSLPELLLPYIKDGISAILVDEVQFISPEQVEYLREVSALGEVPVLCYGLRTRSDTTLWPSVITLMALADSIEEIKTECAFCDHKAVFSKLMNKEGVDNNGIKLSWDEYLPVCAKHYYSDV